MLYNCNTQQKRINKNGGRFASLNLKNRVMNLYSLKDCEKLVENYTTKMGGQCTVLEDGVLGLGFLILHDGQNAKTILIKEVYLNEWSSAHTIRMYNKTPKKYINKIKESCY